MAMTTLTLTLARAMTLAELRAMALIFDFDCSHMHISRPRSPTHQKILFRGPKCVDNRGVVYNIYICMYRFGLFSTGPPERPWIVATGHGASASCARRAALKLRPRRPLICPKS